MTRSDIVDRANAITELRQTIQSLSEVEHQRFDEFREQGFTALAMIEQYFEVMDRVISWLRHCEDLYRVLDDYDKPLSDDELDAIHSELLMTLRRAIDELNILDA